MIKMQILQQQSRRILANYGSIKSCLFPRSYKTLSSVKSLEQWRRQGEPVKPSYVRGLIKDLHDTHQFSEALEASEWMCKKKVFKIFPKDYATRLHLVESVLGLEEAEKYFQSIPENMKDYSVYDTLLRSYTKYEDTLVEAEATFEKMRDLGFLLKPSPYNSMISLYREHKKRDMVKKLQREMMENNVEIDSPIEYSVKGIYRSFKRQLLYPFLTLCKKKGTQMDDETRNEISYLLSLDDVQGAEKVYKKWQPKGPNLDMSIPGLLITRFRAEGNETKAEEMVKLIRTKRAALQLRKFIVYMPFWGTTIGLLAVMVAIVGFIVGLFKDYFTQDPTRDGTILGVAFFAYLVLKHPLLFSLLFFYVISR